MCDNYIALPNTNDFQRADVENVFTYTRVFLFHPERKLSPLPMYMNACLNFIPNLQVDWPLTASHDRMVSSIALNVQPFFLAYLFTSRSFSNNLCCVDARFVHSKSHFILSLLDKYEKCALFQCSAMLHEIHEN